MEYSLALLSREVEAEEIKILTSSDFYLERGGFPPTLPPSLFELRGTRKLWGQAA